MNEMQPELTERYDRYCLENMFDHAKVEHLRTAGCKCQEPLLGWRPMWGPRCRLCNTEASIYVENADGQGQRDHK